VRYVHGQFSFKSIINNKKKNKKQKNKKQNKTKEIKTKQNKNKNKKLIIYMYSGLLYVLKIVLGILHLPFRAISFMGVNNF